MNNLCKECIYYGGDSDDNIIRFILGHHPQCPNFSFNKESFLDLFKKQIQLEVEKINNQSIKILKKEISAEKIINRLYLYLCNRYFPITSNSYIYNWESDLLAVNKDSQYITEYEVKISRGDFKADFNKFDKHKIISDCRKYNFSADIPNYFYYATPIGLLDKSEIPEYAGLIEIGIGINITKRAPILHKEKINKEIVDNLLKKIYYKYWQRN